MATKNISVTEEAYKILERNKKDNESFSKVIVREIGKKGNIKRLREFYGILSKEAGDALEKSILEARKLHREMHKKRINRLKEEFNN
ncbi:antitoxin VapB family protein [Candidatus Pacearchaeota archaeon]|nr:antitoxin VapB family protein [Candidatus Pacearchaeota archaeon]